MIKKVLKIFNIPRQEQILSTEEKIDELFNSLDSESIKVLIGSDLEIFGESFCESISLFRENLKEEFGFILPGIRIKSDCSLQENEFIILINNKKVYQEFAIPKTEYIETNFPKAFEEVFKNHLDSFFSSSILEKYINFAQKENSWLVWNLTCSLTLVEIKTILIDLIKNGKSINNITYVFEKICEQIYIEDYYLHRKPHKISEKLTKIL